MSIVSQSFYLFAPNWPKFFVVLLPLHCDKSYFLILSSSFILLFLTSLAKTHQTSLKVRITCHARMHFHNHSLIEELNLHEFIACYHDFP